MNKAEPCLTRRTHILSPILLSLLLHTNSYATDTTTTTINFRSGTPQSVTVERMHDLAVIQGDIIVGHADDVFSTQKRTKGLSNNTYGAIWPNGIVPYVIDSGLSSVAAGRIRDAVAQWNSVKAVSIVERTSENASAFPNYIQFINQDQCASWVGFQNTGPQSIYSGDDCSTGSMIHEIGHALGLLHEHTRPDRDSFVAVNWANIIAGKEHNFEILSDGLPLGEYDFGSIMHYGEGFFSAKGAGATLTPLIRTPVKIGQRDKASTGDKESVLALYRTNLALIVQADTQNVPAGSSMQLSLYVTNQSDVGANTLEINLPVPANTSLLSYSSSQWLCMQDEPGRDVTCRSTVLTGAADSTISLNLRAPDELGQASVTASLTSLTDDVDKSNNSDSVSFNVIESDGTGVQLASAATAVNDNNSPSFAAANAPLKIASADSGGNGGGGSTGPQPLLLMLATLFLFCCRRTRSQSNK